jgi:hypothetical protein
MRLSRWLTYLLYTWPLIFLLWFVSTKLMEKSRKVELPKEPVYLYGLDWCRETQRQKALLSEKQKACIVYRDMMEHRLERRFEECPTWICKQAAISFQEALQELEK